ncbi:MAG: exodeoxyribonuclease VII large subunit, partial [Paludibacteraceae bacterium]|nr:exodeoxyribonuclease VII large subunit [Paludibacteraceae bacterium]
MMTKQYTLSELCAEIEDALAECLAPTYWVQTEISSLNVRGGHMYLELVESANSKQSKAPKTDMAAKMRATCWQGNRELLMNYFEAETGQRLQAGMQVLIEVEVQYHAVYGLSLSIVNIDPSYTVGSMARQRQQTIAQLEADGLLEAQQLIPLPTLIRRIAVVSSASAAGYGDFCHQLENSGYLFEISLYAATMQGENAARSILAALEAIDAEADKYDSVVIIRGGGATTDLSCFDSYNL